MNQPDCLPATSHYKISTAQGFFRTGMKTPLSGDLKIKDISMRRRREVTADTYLWHRPRVMHVDAQREVAREERQRITRRTYLWTLPGVLWSWNN